MNIDKEKTVRHKSFVLATKMIDVATLLNEKRQFVIANQIVRSGLAVGALIREAEHAESRKDFIHKHSIALKEANETYYWLELISTKNFLDSEMLELLSGEMEEIIKMLVKIIKTTKARSNEML